jgi:ribosomal-protein-alanine N-acetyltransferase
MITETSKIHIRWMCGRDVYPSIVADDSFDAWTEQNLRRCLKKKNCIGVVGEIDDRVVSFMAYHLSESSINVLRFVVHYDWRRQRCGSAMIEKLKQKLSAQRRSKIIIHVRESNLSGQLFLKSQQFWVKKIKRSYYEDTGEDAYLFVFNYGQVCVK